MKVSTDHAPPLGCSTSSANTTSHTLGQSGNIGRAARHGPRRRAYSVGPGMLEVNHSQAMARYRRAPTPIRIQGGGAAGYYLTAPRTGQGCATVVESHHIRTQCRMPNRIVSQ